MSKLERIEIENREIKMERIEVENREIEIKMRNTCHHKNGVSRNDEEWVFI